MNIPALAGLLVGVLVGSAGPRFALPVVIPDRAAVRSEAAGVAPDRVERSAERLASSLPAPLSELAREVLARNPELARARREADAIERLAPQVGSLPDPMATLTAFLVQPETRVGPQQLAAGVSQRFPWVGKLALRERAALYAAAAVRGEAEARAVALVTETRRLYFELAFLAAQEQAVRSDRATPPAPAALRCS